MKTFLHSLVYFVLGCTMWPNAVNAQAHNDPSGAVAYSPSSESLFDTDVPLTIKLTGNISELMNDRGDNPELHPLILSYNAGQDHEVSLSIQAKTRGHFRRTMGGCTYPPLSLQFSKSDTLASSIFREQRKLKLVVPCRGDDYIIREWLAYKIYNLVTPQSFRTRLVTIELNDTKKKKATSPFYGMLLEEERQMAKRNQDILIKRTVRPEQTEPAAFIKMAVFQYLIGNTDWSVQYQNTKLIAADSNAVPVAVPYDFDQSGLVNTPYAKPAEELQMSSVRERRYRGYCMEDMARFDEAIAQYNRIKTDMYKLYSDCPLLDAKYIKSTLQYFDEFYKTINDPSDLKREFSYPCDKNGTGRVVIKGLKED
ncbi:MAG TPA: hypothetical protein VFW07_10675 [Parafilimonas sp.]|nr:hypothetical protein [Parafilimonas sp.]